MYIKLKVMRCRQTKTPPNIHLRFLKYCTDGTTLIVSTKDFGDLVFTYISTSCRRGNPNPDSSSLQVYTFQDFTFYHHHQWVLLTNSDLYKSSRPLDPLSSRFLTVSRLIFLVRVFKDFLILYNFSFCPFPELIFLQNFLQIPRTITLFYIILFHNTTPFIFVSVNTGV